MWFDDDEKPKRKTIDKNTRNAVWIKYMGNKVEGKCYCCQIKTIHITDFQVGHNKAVAKGGKNHIENLRPICGPCNRGMGTMSIERYKKRFEPANSNKKSTAKNPTSKSETSITKKELLGKLPKTKLKKIIKELNLEYDEFWNGDEKEDYLDFLLSSRKASITKIQEIVG